jgi:predicted GNAT family acetyltransferase
MEARLFDRAEAFLQATGGMLEKDAVANQLILANAARLAGVDGASGTLMAAVFSGAEPVLAALMVPSHRLVLSNTGDPAVAGAAAEILAERLAAHRLPGVIGTEEPARRFAGRHCADTGAVHRLVQEMGIYKLTRVVPPRETPGRLRPATDEDRPLQEIWRAGFWTDAHRPWEGNEVAESVRKDLADGYLFVWENDRPVCTAVCRRPMGAGIAIGGVYTPPELRRRGYASACVAALSQHLLDRGYEWCSLFTDLANPTSNGIYRAIGYEPVCEVVEIAFDR